MYAGWLNSVGFNDVTTESSSRTQNMVVRGNNAEENETIKGIRKHNHYRVTVTYGDNEISGRVYNNHEKAEKCAARQKKSPVVKNTRIEQID
jgi:hypothetical protein